MAACAFVTAILLAPPAAGQPVPGGQSAPGHEALIKSIEELVKQLEALKKEGFVLGSKTSDELKKLAAAIGEVDCRSVPTPAACLTSLEALVLHLAAIPSEHLANVNTRLITAVGHLLAVAGRTDSLATAKLAAVVLKEQLQATPQQRIDADLKKALADLPIERAPPKKPQPVAINILGAYFGDLNLIVDAAKHLQHEIASKHPPFINDPDKQLMISRGLELHSYKSKRFCSATHAVRSLCQGAAACLGKGDGTGASLTGTLMCGFEPAPYAEPRTKGLLINYQCIPADWPKMHWAGLFPFEYYPPADIDAEAKAGFQRKWALVRNGEAARIVCSIEKSGEAEGVKK